MGAVLLQISMCSVVAAAVPPAGSADHDPAAGIGEFIDELLATLDVPGAAVVIVANGDVLLSSGHGVRSVAANDPVTSDTAFAISSLTKAFTATAAAALVGEGAIHWQTRAADLLPALKMRDPVALERTTLADLLAHRTGIGRRSAIAINASLTRGQLLEHLDLIEPEAEFRAGYVYSSMMYAVAGEMLARAADLPYENVVKSRVLTPLGMTHTTFGPPAGSAARVAAPHLVTGGEPVPIEPVDISLFAAGMGLYSTADDMGRWLLFQLGALGVSEVAPEIALEATRRPQVVLRSDGLPDAPIVTYGMGWEVSVWKGHRRLSHGGGSAGFTAQVMLLPDDGVGVAVMTNSALNPIPDLLCERVALQALGEPVPDRLGQVLPLLARMDEMREAERTRLLRDRNPESQPSHPLEVYTGTYVHPLYGEIEVGASDDGLTLLFHRLPFTVEHLHDDAFLIGHPLFDEKPAEFISEGDVVTTLVIPFDRSERPVRFEADRAVRADSR